MLYELCREVSRVRLVFLRARFAGAFFSALRCMFVVHILDQRRPLRQFPLDESKQRL